MDLFFFLVGLFCVCACENPQYIGANCFVFKDRHTMQLLGKTYINHTANISSVKHCRCSETGWIIFKQKLPNNGWIVFPSLLCPDLSDGSFAVWREQQLTLCPGCRGLAVSSRGRLWSGHPMLPVDKCPLEDGDKCLPQLSRLIVCAGAGVGLTGSPSAFSKVPSPWDRLAWRSHLPLDTG